MKLSIDVSSENEEEEEEEQQEIDTDFADFQPTENLEDLEQELRTPKIED